MTDFDGKLKINWLILKQINCILHKTVILLKSREITKEERVRQVIKLQDSPAIYHNVKRI